MMNTTRSGKPSRREAIVGGGAALGVNAMLASIAGGTAGATLLGDSARATPAPATLTRFAAEHFEPLAGQAFMVDGHRVKLRAIRRGPATPSRFRDQFALSFSAPPAPSIASGLVSVAHPAIGRHDMLVTEVIDGPGRTLEICFA